MTTAPAKESSIAVTVRVRPFTVDETSHLRQNTNEPVFLGDGSFAGSTDSVPNTSTSTGTRLAGAGKQLRKVIDVVDDKMLIFDPPESNPLSSMQRAAFPKTTNRIREHRFVFDRLFDENCSQEDVYGHTTKPLIDNILDGYNATVFAYGATGCGKTHTISGMPEDPGIIFLTMKELFERIESLQDTNNVDVSLSYLEIYNETIRDLLMPSNNKPMLLREDSEKRISVSNLSSYRPNSVHEVMDMILQGNQNRTMSPTEANATSSRSHAVLQINVTQRARTAELSEAHTFATLSIIDLAGSERAAATKNRGERLMEGANINKSLLALGNCINALCDPRRRGHVPYRDSKLTRLLKFSLGGNCKTVMIVCVSPSSAHYDETLNTLKYADRAKKIKTKVVRNEHNLDRHVGSYLKMITEQRAEIEQLRNRESKAVGIAMQKHEKVRQQCRAALEDGKKSLDTTIERTKDNRAARAKALARLRSLASQINQVQVWTEALNQHIYYEANDDDDEEQQQEEYQAFTRIKQAAQSLMTKLYNEQDSLQQYCSSLQDQTAVDSAVESIKQRIRETTGWAEEDTQHFLLYAELQKQQLQNGVLQQGAMEVPVSGSLKAMSDLFFKLLSRLRADGGSGGYVQEMTQMCEELLDAKNFNDTSISLDTLPPPSTNNTHAAPTTTKKKLGFKRPFSSNKRHTVVIRSPAPAKKPTKRVRWEDDSSESDISMNNVQPASSASPPPPLLNLTASSSSSSPAPAPAPAAAAAAAVHEDTDAMDTTVDMSGVDDTLDSSTTNSPATNTTKQSLANHPLGKKKFGVKSELKRKPGSVLKNSTTASTSSNVSTPAVLGMNKRAIGRVEKENMDSGWAHSSHQHHSKDVNNTNSNTNTNANVNSPNRNKLGVPLRVTVPTAASTMKQVSRSNDGKS